MAPYREIVWILLQYCADPNLSNSALGAPLNLATFPSNMDEEIVEILIGSGANDKSLNISPLHEASRELWVYNLDEP